MKLPAASKVERRHGEINLMKPMLIAMMSAGFIIGMGWNAFSQDVDGDQMPDSWEFKFGLNPADPDDAYPDYDGDYFSNLRESALLTDPFAPDTDCDGFNDDVDASPISRAYIQWGAPRFTTGDQYDYAHPDWFLAAYKNGGEWMVDLTTTQSFWFVSACESNRAGSLSIDLDRTILTNNLRYDIHYFGAGNSSLYVDLLNTNGEIVAENLYDNLLGGSNEDVVICLDVPTALFPEAAVIHLRSGEPGDSFNTLSGVALAKEESFDSVKPSVEPGMAKTDVMVFEGLLYIDEDGDGLDNEQERQLGTSDYCVDTDGDGISDYDKAFNKNDEDGPTDPGGDGDGDEDENKKSGVIYVDHAVGNDQHTGRARDVAGQDGPKKTIRKGMAAVDADGAHTLIIKSGIYNENLDLRGKNVKVVIEGNVRL